MVMAPMVTKLRAMYVILYPRGSLVQSKHHRIIASNVEITKEKEIIATRSIKIKVTKIVATMMIAVVCCYLHGRPASLNLSRKWMKNLALMPALIAFAVELLLCL